MSRGHGQTRHLEPSALCSGSRVQRVWWSAASSVLRVARRLVEACDTPVSFRSTEVEARENGVELGNALVRQKRNTNGTPPHGSCRPSAPTPLFA
jgi:hypothetical protein